MIRLDKMLSHYGFGTRSQVKKIIRKGRVLVNDEVCQDDDRKINENDLVSVDGAVITYNTYHYLLLNKPAGYVSSKTDDYYPSVLHLIDEPYVNELFPIGRLDADTHGLLLLSNDGKLAHNLLAPKKHVEKAYLVKLQKNINAEFIKNISNQIIYKDIIYQSAKIDIIDDKTIIMTISEGKFHQIKLMVESQQNEVIYLKRIKMGSLSLDEKLDEGEYRSLSKEEIDLLKGGN